MTKVCSKRVPTLVNVRLVVNVSKLMKANCHCFCWGFPGTTSRPPAMCEPHFITTNAIPGNVLLVVLFVLVSFHILAATLPRVLGSY